ncbi:hypothetical protein N7536_006325 [Penicillium majusculum]|nr:hypothetical protein N7536_006325 [Penicillium majusculum]
MAIFELIRFLFPLFPFLMLSVIFVASYWFPSTTLPAMEAVLVFRRQTLQIHYLLDHAVEIVNTFGWLWIRFCIASGVVSLTMNEILKPIVIFLARKAYG